MKNIVYYFFGVFLFGNIQVFGQVDTTVLELEDFLEVVLREHPVAKQANLLLENADAELLMAKGNFDPKISSDFNQKRFDEKNYYQLFSGKLTVPTPLGLDVVGGYENTEGVFLNPENNTDPFGLWNIGIEANLLQGLLIDERRTALRTARVLQNMAVNEQQIELNKLVLDAGLTYLEWQKNYFIRAVIDTAIVVAEDYFANTKASFFGGEYTAIDTLEALIILQDRQTLLQENLGDINNAIQMVNNFLWLNNAPVYLAENTAPEDYNASNFIIPRAQNLDSVLNNHPEILAKLNKLETLEIEQRMKREKLKPKLKAKFNPLIATSADAVTPNYSMNDYKWGLDFSFPLFLRKERGGIQQGEVKILTTELDIENKRNELGNKIINSLQQLEILNEQLLLQQQNVAGYELLLNAENTKFLFGESSVFLLNKRQEKFIDGQIKLIKTRVKLEKEKLKYQFYLNNLVP